MSEKKFKQIRLQQLEFECPTTYERTYCSNYMYAQTDKNTIDKSLPKILERKRKGNH